MAMQEFEVPPRKRTKQFSAEEIFKKVAPALEQKFGFHPENVARKMQVYDMSFYGRPLNIAPSELPDWRYFRDIRTKAAFIFNLQTNEIRLINSSQDWTEELCQEYRQSP